MTRTPVLVVHSGRQAYLVRLLPTGAVTRSRGTFAVTQPEVEVYDANRADDSAPDGDGVGPLGKYVGSWSVAWLLERLDSEKTNRSAVGLHLLDHQLVTRIAVWARTELRRITED